MFSARSSKKELLDEDGIPFADIRQNMRELNFINTWLGGHQISINGLKKILHGFPVGKRILICEIGCGGGDNLYALYNWCIAQGYNIQLTGIDFKPECIEFAKIQYPLSSFTWVCSDYAVVEFEQKPDIIFSSLFCHHFSNEALVNMMIWMQQHSLAGFFINDLHRHRIAYYAIKILTHTFSKSYLVKNDAPVSVTSGFSKADWRHILQQSGLLHYSIQWKWAFRWLVTYTHV